MKVKDLSKLNTPFVAKLKDLPTEVIYQGEYHTKTTIIDEAVLVFPNMTGTPLPYKDKRYYRFDFFNGSKMYSKHVDGEFKFTKSRSTKHKLFKQYEEYKLLNLISSLKYNGSIGADPELFIDDKDGNMIPAFEFLDGKGGKDRTLENTYGGHPMYWDGYQAEFTTWAGTCLGWLTDSIYAGIAGVLAKAQSKFPGAKISTQTTCYIPAERLEKDKKEHVEFGCMPSLNAYGMEGIKGDGREVNFRSAGGHLHFGLSGVIGSGIKVTTIQAERMVKALDAILGVACVSLFNELDNPLRRTMYGLAGEYRLPPHGLEYRVLSNAWLFHPLLTQLVFDLGRSALMMGHSGLISHYKYDEKETIRIINEGDVDAARKMLKNNKDLLIQILAARYPNGGEQIAYSMFINGHQSFIKDINNVAGNWGITGSDKYKSHAETPGHTIVSEFKKAK